MLLTRTIRRKMVVGLAMVLVMLLTLATGAISGLSSYRDVIADLTFSIHEAPRRADLVTAVGVLLEPLTAEDHRNVPKFQQHEFRRKLIDARKRILDYRKKLDRLPTTPAEMRRRPVTEALLAQIESRLAHAEHLSKTMHEPDHYADDLTLMLQEIGYAMAIAERVPDHQDGLNGTLRHASSVYRSRLRLIGWTSAVVILLFVLLLRYVYGGIFSPLSKLHQGARRVAQGDFDYRVKINTHDEMAEMAEAFNQMTARFQEIACDLDRKVHERSRQLVRSERLAGVGFLAAGVAHEINNPLQAIMVASESLESRSDEFLKNADPADANVVRQYLGMMRSEAVRCKDITSRLLNFSRGQENVRTRTDVGATITEVLTLVGHLSKFRDRTIAFSPPAGCHVEANPSEIKQVVLNLVANALESMNSGGTLSIDVAEEIDQVVITFEDSGCGMSQDVLDNLFEPFFTQRRDGKGTGLGMSISHRIVRDHGGTIDAHSEGPGRGSTFRVHLPRRAVVREAA